MRTVFFPGGKHQPPGPPARDASRRSVTRSEGADGPFAAGRPAKLASLAAAAVSIALGLTLTGCGSSGHPASNPAVNPAGSSAGSTQDSADYARIEADVRCLRAHGVPSFPDPVYDPSDGRWHYGDYQPAIPSSAQQACQHLDPSAVDPSPPVPQAQFQALVRLAECIRQHGVPTWPDPNPLGEFPLPPQLLQVKSNPTERNATEACQRYFPSGGLDVVNASNP